MRENTHIPNCLTYKTYVTARNIGVDKAVHSITRLNSGHVFADTNINTNRISFVDEHRRLKLVACLNCCGLGGGVACNCDLASILNKSGSNCIALVFDNSPPFHLPDVTSGILHDKAVSVLKDYFTKNGKG